MLYWALLYSPGDEVHAISVVTHGVQPPRLARLSGWHDATWKRKQASTLP